MNIQIVEPAGSEGKYPNRQTRRIGGQISNWCRRNGVRLFHLSIGLFSSLFIGLFIALPAHASEGTAVLSDTSGVRCYLASVLVDEADYQLVMTCRNLSVPPTTERLFYVAWARRMAQPDREGFQSSFGRSPYIGLGEVQNGKLAADTREPFDEVLITSETESSPSQPDLERVALKGTVTPFSFEAGTTILPTSVPAGLTVTATPRPTITPRPTEGRSVVGTAFRLFLGFLGVLVVVAVVISILQKRSASK